MNLIEFSLRELLLFCNVHHIRVGYAIVAFVYNVHLGRIFVFRLPLATVRGPTLKT